MDERLMNEMLLGRFRSSDCYEDGFYCSSATSSHIYGDGHGDDDDDGEDSYGDDDDDGEDSYGDNDHVGKQGYDEVCGAFSNKARVGNEVEGQVGGSTPLRELRPIAITEMEVGDGMYGHVLSGTHYGRVLFGTLCVDPVVRRGMLQTIVKDQFGNTIDVCMSNNHGGSLPAPSAQDIKKAYCIGQHIAIKVPRLLRTGFNDGLFISVPTPDCIEKFEKLPSEAEWLAFINPEILLSEGQMYAIEERWELAIQCYTQCIAAVAAQKNASASSTEPMTKLNEVGPNEVGSLSDMVVQSLCGRAKVFINTKRFEEAMLDCGEALKMDPHHCKSLQRKGLALQAMFRFEEACVCLEAALISNAGNGKNKRAKKIRAALAASRKCCRGNQQGRHADLARYLLHPYKDEDGATIPTFPNHVGPVAIKKVRSGIGRGMFATRNAKAGDVLLVSNAMAICYQKEGAVQTASVYENERENLVCKIYSMTKDSPQSRHLLSYLAGSGCTPNIFSIPEMIALSESYQLPSAIHHRGSVQVEKGGISEIVRLNAFGPHQFCQLLARHEYACDFMKEKDYLGLWFLPSFINHSCVPNASRLVVGQAMFLHAARDINAGEEVTLPYFDTLMPLKQRIESCKRWGFRCDCKRCAFEQMMQKPLSKVSDSFEHLYKWIVETVMINVSTNSLKGFGDWNFELLKCKDLEVSLSVLAGVMASAPKSMVNDEQHKWIMASYSSLLWMDVLPKISKAHPDVKAGVSSLHLAEAMQCAVPGHIRALILFATVKVDQLTPRTMAICTSVFGAHEPHVLLELIRLYACAVPFP